MTHKAQESAVSMMIVYCKGHRSGTEGKIHTVPTVELDALSQWDQGIISAFCQQCESRHINVFTSEEGPQGFGVQSFNWDFIA